MIYRSFERHMHHPVCRALGLFLVLVATSCNGDFVYQNAISYDGVDSVIRNGELAANPTVITTSFDRYSDACGATYTFSVAYQSMVAPVSFSPCTCDAGFGSADNVQYNDVTNETDAYRIYVKDGTIAVWGEGTCSNGTVSCGWRDGEVTVDDSCAMLLGSGHGP